VFVGRVYLQVAALETNDMRKRCNSKVTRKFLVKIYWWCWTRI